MDEFHKMLSDPTKITILLPSGCLWYIWYKYFWTSRNQLRQASGYFTFSQLVKQNQNGLGWGSGVQRVQFNDGLHRTILFLSLLGVFQQSLDLLWEDNRFKDVIACHLKWTR